MKPIGRHPVITPFLINTCLEVILFLAQKAMTIIIVYLTKFIIIIERNCLTSFHFVLTFSE